MRLTLFNQGRLGLVDGSDIIDVTEQLAGSGPYGPEGALHRHIERLADGHTGPLDLTGVPHTPWPGQHSKRPFPARGRSSALPSTTSTTRPRWRTPPRSPTSASSSRRTPP